VTTFVLHIIFTTPFVLFNFFETQFFSCFAWILGNCLQFYVCLGLENPSSKRQIMEDILSFGIGSMP